MFTQDAWSPEIMGAASLSEKHRTLLARLSPLRKTQRDLERRLGSGATEEVQPAALSDDPAERRQQEFFVRSGWKSAFADKFRPRSSISSRHGREGEADEVTRVISTCREDMLALWGDATVQDAVRQRKVPLIDSAEL